MKLGSHLGNPGRRGVCQSRREGVRFSVRGRSVDDTKDACMKMHGRRWGFLGRVNRKVVLGVDPQVFMDVQIFCAASLTTFLHHY